MTDNRHLSADNGRTTFVGRQMSAGVSHGRLLLVNNVARQCWPINVGRVSSNVGQHLSADTCRAVLKHVLFSPTFSSIWGRSVTVFTQCHCLFPENMDAEWCEEDVEKVINFYELHTCLYDTRSLEYRNKDRKRALEKELAESLHKSGNLIQL